VVPARSVRADGWRLLVATFTLIAFALQSFLTQTHIHIPQPASAATLVAKIADAEANKQFGLQRNTPADKVPTNDDSVKCPLCQAVGYAGNFVAPSAAAALLLPSAAISVLPLALTLRSPSETPSHIWQGRGPPNS
jgi:hypothetical protein